MFFSLKMERSFPVTKKESIEKEKECFDAVHSNYSVPFVTLCALNLLRIRLMCGHVIGQVTAIGESLRANVANIILATFNIFDVLDIDVIGESATGFKSAHKVHTAFQAYWLILL